MGATLLAKYDQLRGHPMYQDIGSGEYRYSDNGLPVAVNPRACGKCRQPNRADGHDACIGKLPGVMNACCGHGETAVAYVQYSDGSRISEEEALKKMADMKAV